MPTPEAQSGFVNHGNARQYYETAGQGIPFVMIHAGVADSRQWNNEFEFFARTYGVVRYDMRGYGKSEPVDGEFNHMDDLIAVLNALELHEPVILMGCSMGGGLAMDFALTHPSKVKALIMVGSGPSGLELDVPTPAKFADVEKAFEAGDLDLVAELETQIWFDGTGRTPEQVHQGMRKLLYEMNRQALAHETKQLGKRLPNTQTPAFDRLSDLKVPVLVIVGAHDNPYILASADYMVERIPSVQKVIIEDAAHLPNMDHPEEFKAIVKDFLENYSSG
jgi:pimeloyl-ACP methyl ester carboxylesterase